MNYCPYYRQTYYPSKVIHPNSYIRIFHASPNAPAVDIYANDSLIVKNLVYKGFSPYLTAAPGNYNIKVYPSGKTTNPVINTDLTVPENFIINSALIGNLPEISLYPIPEPTTAQNTGSSCVRFIHLSPDAPAVDIKLSDGTILFSNVGYKDITNYACIPSGTYAFTVSPTGTGQTALVIPNVTLNQNTFNTIYAVGQTGENPALEAVTVPEPR